MLQCFWLILKFFIHYASIFVVGSIKACKKAALSCEEGKFEQYKLVKGGQVADELNQQMQNCLEKIKVLEH